MRILISICLLTLLQVGLFSCKSEGTTEDQTSGSDSTTTMQQGERAASECMRIENREHYCRTNACLDTIMLFHSLSEDKFNAMKGYYPGQVPTIYSAVAINSIIRASGATCEEWIAKVTQRGDLLEFTVEKEEQKLIAYYSLALIQGILNRNADSFRFYRAKKLNTHQDDIIFSVDFANGTTKFYDLSESIP